MRSDKVLYTVHSNRSSEEFISLLHTFEIKLVVDVRAYARSRWYPHFNAVRLSSQLKIKNIDYLHLSNLGGRRKPRVDSRNSALVSEGFRGFADYMETSAFYEAVIPLENAALQLPTAIMCSEALWWNCHRALISDFLKMRDWAVRHILSKTELEDHHYTNGARVLDGQVIYNNPGLFD